jgi:predicted nucleotidyltransferase
VEPELIARAETLTLLPGLELLVATVADLMALKVLARNDRTRPQDADDLLALLEVASAADRAQVARTLALIQQRGFGRGRRLLQLWRTALAASPERAGFKRRRLR